MTTDELTVEQVAGLTGWAQSTVRKHADALGARRKGARKLLFTEEAVRAGLIQLRKHNHLIPIAEMQ
jgi:hypothetical protein